MVHLQIIPSLQEYKQQRSTLPLPHAIKLTEENYVILCDIIKYMQFYIIDAKTGSYVDSTANNIKILINGIEQEYVVNDNLYILSYITNQDYNFANTLEITVLSDIDNAKYQLTMLTTTPNRVNNSPIPLFEYSTADEIFISWSNTSENGLVSGYDIDTHVVIYGPKNGSDTEYERKGEVAYSTIKRYFIDDNILIVLDIDDQVGGTGETVTKYHITDLAKDYIIYYVQYDWSKGYTSVNSTGFTKRNALVFFRSMNSTNGKFDLITPPDATGGRYWKVLSIKNHEMLESPNVIGDNTDLSSEWHLFTSLNGSDTNDIYTNGYNAGLNDYAEGAYTPNPHQNDPTSYYSWECGYIHGKIMAADTVSFEKLGYMADHYDLTTYAIKDDHPVYTKYADGYTKGWIKKLQNIIENNITNAAHRGDTAPEDLGLVESDYTNIYFKSLNYTIDNIWPTVYDIAWYNKIAAMAKDAVQDDENKNDTTPEDLGLVESDYTDVIYSWGENITDSPLVRENAWEYEYNYQWLKKTSTLPPSLSTPGGANKNWFDGLLNDIEIEEDTEKL